MIKAGAFQFDPTQFQKQFRGGSLRPGDLICAIGNYFLGAPYEPETLESRHKERLIVNYRQFDCFTFVETVLALVRCVVAGRIAQSELRRALQLLRYRGGIIDGYSSRLHYFTDWLRDNEQKGILRDISRKLGAVARRKKIDYMTAHCESYPALKNEKEWQKMRLVEKNISRKSFNIIGRDEIGLGQAKIQDGDIIAFTANQEGLDVAHVGFAFRRGRALRLLHASSREGAVVISQKTVPAYLKQNKKFSGIIVARLL
jgi:hypothetical protein